MKIVLHAPFGAQSKESGLMYLLGSYLKTLSHEVVQLRCNGVFSLCDRDAEASWKRSIDSCLRCSCEQATLAKWARLPLLDLSSFLTPGEIVDTRRWIAATNTGSLHSIALRGKNLLSLCRGSFRARFGVEEPDLKNRKQEPILRRLLLSAARTSLAARRFNNVYQPDVLFVAGGQDFISHSFVVQSEEQSREVVLFEMDLNQRCIKIHHPREREKVLPCQLLLTDVTMMRSDVTTWPPEVLSEIESILSFLDIFQAQISLPLAK